MLVFKHYLRRILNVVTIFFFLLGCGNSLFSGSKYPHKYCFYMICFNEDRTVIKSVSLPVFQNKLFFFIVIPKIPEQIKDSYFFKKHRVIKTFKSKLLGWIPEVPGGKRLRGNEPSWKVGLSKLYLCWYEKAQIVWPQNQTLM